MKDIRFRRAEMVAPHGGLLRIEFMMQMDYLLVGVLISSLIYLRSKIHCIVCIQMIIIVKKIKGEIIV